MRINKIVDPLYTNQDTKEFAIFNGKASGTIEEGTTDDLKAFTSSDFSAGFLCECRAADEGCPRSSEIHRGYLARPAIAEYRVVSYDHHKVHYWYEDHRTGKRVDVVSPVMKFIYDLVQHIPPKHFRMVGRYSLYSRGKTKSHRR